MSGILRRDPTSRQLGRELRDLVHRMFRATVDHAPANSRKGATETEAPISHEVTQRLFYQVKMASSDGTHTEQIPLKRSTGKSWGFPEAPFSALRDTPEEAEQPTRLPPRQAFPNSGRWRDGGPYVILRSCFHLAGGFSKASLGLRRCDGGARRTSSTRLPLLTRGRERERGDTGTEAPHASPPSGRRRGRSDGSRPCRGDSAVDRRPGPRHRRVG